MTVHYLELVCPDVDKQCGLLAAAQGLTFGAPQPELGNARVAEGADGTRIGVRAPLAEHETPIVRSYLSVDDIGAAVRDAEAAGAVIAYPPTQQGDAGTFAIYILDGLQVGVWQDA
mgnify:CR=1 FL=1